MKIQDYKLKEGFKKANADIVVDYENVVANINAILEDISIHNKPFDMDCFLAYQEFFDVCNKKKAIILDELKMWHEKLESFIKLFSYEESTVLKLKALRIKFEKFFETYSYMQDRITKIKKSYDTKIELFKINNIVANPLTKDEMEMYFKSTARFYLDVANNMEDFVDEHIRPQIVLADIICSKELDFNEAIMFHKINQKIEDKVVEDNEDSKL